ncbi:type IV secretory system conjugative DNA transfer family protein [Domibacillus sp. A3M-37]|uniref:VirD4-like conjugal transfer protein, CD1115 family n=1 Tax=Domibacillus sp. A3M-37 TaxID=2962037 RepID=UPI0020B82E4D|nr:type IV secretory system conjugative DNA transfer family protein [Domibacillus sp. A3M-37]MCP3763729.1 type IV secretory system conjugative DNA transfer family protein [Domibacillus sp. A3M-37]
MENEKTWKRYSKKLALPVTIFLLTFTFTLLALNTIVNIFHGFYDSYFVSGTFFKPKEMSFNSGMITGFGVLVGNIIMLGLIGLLSAAVSSFATYKFLTNFGKIGKDQKGSSRFTTLKEIKEQYKAVPELADRYSGGGGVPVSRHRDKIFIDDSAVNNLIIGTTRSGKGETFIFPTIDIYSRAEKQPSMIFNDPKGELYAASKQTLEGLGYHVEVLNLMNPLQSMSYNLLQLTKEEFFAENYSLAQQYARSVAFMLYNDATAKDKFWQNSSIDLCTSLILGLCEHCRNAPEKINMYNVALMMSDLATKTVEDENGNEISALDNFFNQFPENHPAKMQYATINFSGGQTRASILANTNAKLGVFTLDGTAKLTSDNTLEMTKFGFHHWLRGKSQSLTRLTILFENGKKETIMTDSNGGFNLYHNQHVDIGEKIKISFENNVTTFTVSDWDKESGELHVTAENDLTKLNSVMQFEKPIALFMIVPDYDATFNVIASLYVKQVYTTLARTASNVNSGKCFREVIFLLDEFGNMPAIDDLASILTVCLGRNIRFNLVVQAYSQIEKLYGDDWKTIDGNTNNTFYILTDDHSTAEMISKKIGDKTIITKSRSGETISLKKSKTENVDARPLLNADELMRLREGEMVVIRTIKRQDTNRKRIQQFPIFNTGQTAMKYRWEYLSDYYDTAKSINDIDIPCTHAALDLNEVRVSFDEQPVNAENHKEDHAVANEVVEQKVVEKEMVESRVVETEKATPKVRELVFSNGEVESSFDRKPPKPKTGLDREEPKEAVPVEKELNEDFPMFEEPKEAVRVEEELSEDKAQNNLNEVMFRKLIGDQKFEEMFSQNFASLDLLTVKDLLLAHQNDLSEKTFLKLQKFVENELGKDDNQ